MKDYYFLASYLPQLEIGHIPQLGFTELKELIRVNVNEKDQEIFKRFLRQVDIENMRALWLGENHDPRGNLTQSQLQTALQEECWSDEEPFEESVCDFLKKYPTTEKRVTHFPLLLAHFYQERAEESSRFLREYSQFQREWQLVMVGLRAKILNLDLARQLQYEDAQDPLVAQILAQKESEHYEPPFEYKELKPLFETHLENPLELHKALTSYQFDQIVSMGGDLFSIERILNYAARLLLVERWLEMNATRGMDEMDAIERNSA